VIEDWSNDAELLLFFTTLQFSQVKPEQSSLSAPVQPKPPVEKKPCTPTPAGRHCVDLFNFEFTESLTWTHNVS